MIAIQGQAGSFHHEAATKLAKSLIIDSDIFSCDKFRDVFEAVKHDKATYGLVAIENNLHGSINEVYRLLKEYKKNGVWIIADIRMQISQNLVSTVGSNREDLGDGKGVTVISHPVALEQVYGWLRENLPKALIENYRDTAGSVQRVVETDNPKLVAVAGKIAADTYGAEIIAPDIQDDPDNYTRFVLFQKNKEKVTNATHGSMIVTTDHSEGALLRVLQVFADHHSNMTKLDSHPIPGDKQHYDFYIDYELPSEGSDQLSQAISDTGATVIHLGEFVRVN